MFKLHCTYICLRFVSGTICLKTNRNSVVVLIHVHVLPRNCPETRPGVFESCLSLGSFPDVPVSCLMEAILHVSIPRVSISMSHNRCLKNVSNASLIWEISLQWSLSHVLNCMTSTCMYVGLCVQALLAGWLWLIPEQLVNLDTLHSASQSEVSSSASLSLSSCSASLSATPATKAVITQLQSSSYMWVRLSLVQQCHLSNWNRVESSLHVDLCVFLHNSQTEMDRNAKTI